MRRVILCLMMGVMVTFAGVTFELNGVSSIAYANQVQVYGAKGLDVVVDTDSIYWHNDKWFSVIVQEGNLYSHNMKTLTYDFSVSDGGVWCYSTSIDANDRVVSSYAYVQAIFNACCQ